MFGRYALMLKAAWNALIGKVVMPLELLGDEPSSALVLKKPVSPKGDTGIEAQLPADDSTDCL